MSKLKIAVLMHTDMVPPLENLPKKIDSYETPWITEYNVVSTLKELGHDVHCIGAYDNLDHIVEGLRSDKFDLVFNLFEQFGEHTDMEAHIACLLDMSSIPFTGCNPKGLMLAKDKALAKKILQFHEVTTPDFYLVKNRLNYKIPNNIQYPIIVKCLNEEASYKLAQASVVHNDDKLKERIDFLHDLEQDVILEEFVAGREFFVGIIGHQKLMSFPPVELVFNNVERPENEIYGEQAKWNKKYRDRKGIRTEVAKIDENMSNELQQIAKDTYKCLELSGYARIDLRVDADGKIFVLEANPNPNLAKDDELAIAALAAGLEYPDLIKKITQLGAL